MVLVWMDVTPAMNSGHQESQTTAMGTATNVEVWWGPGEWNDHQPTRTQGLVCELHSEYFYCFILSILSVYLFCLPEVHIEELSN